jgi:hypothetical protein
MEICLEHIEGKKYQPVDCKTGEAVNPCRAGDRRRGKRAPSKYNLHMKECLKRKSGPIQARFKECAAEYKKKK